MNRWIALGAIALAAVSATPVAGVAQVGEPRTAAPVRHSWWNDEVLAKQLSLTPEQRRKMDAAWQTKKQAPRQASATAGSRDFYAALEAGEWDRARRQIAEVPKTLPNPVPATLEGKLAVVQLLTDEQRQKLAEEHPDLLQRRWDPRPTWTAPESRTAPAPRPVQ
jgi:Spy/CpxP family protein refolding chaperone